LSEEKPLLLCAPSQNGLFAEPPQRHSAIMGWHGIGPLRLASSVSPSTRKGPFGLSVILGF
jgi:hypothetical protein